MPVLSSISVEKDEYGFKRVEKFRTERGLELSIQTTAGGLYEIIPHGAGSNPPKVCNERFTSHLKARNALEDYIKSTDRLGFAEYPSKPPEKFHPSRQQKKVKTDESST
jgi:hypothetical protein